jgi:hypothetical protein
MATLRKVFIGLPDPRSPAGKHFDWPAFGLPHPDSPEGRRFEWNSVGLAHPGAPAANASDRNQPLAYGTVRTRLVTVSKAEIHLPKTAEAVCPRWGVFGQGFFEVHQGGYECSSGERTPRKPEVDVLFDRHKGKFEIRSITIYTLKIINNPDPRSLPLAGENVTNDKGLGVRMPKDDPEGKGYWRDVISEMEKYEDQGVNLQWYAPGSTAYHEELHNQQFREGLRKNRHALLRKVEEAINLRFLVKGTVGVTEAEVRDAAREVIEETIKNVYAVTGKDSEPEAYRKTFAARWKPEIEKIRKYAREHGWN